MMLHKSCPKCQGDLGLERDIYGGPPDLICLQCGYTPRPHERFALLSAKLEHTRDTSAPTVLQPRVARRAS